MSPSGVATTGFQQGDGTELNSAQESFCNAQKMPAQLLAWALAPLAATEPRQEADSLTARRRKREEYEMREGPGLTDPGLSQPRQPGSPSQSSMLGRAQCPAAPWRRYDALSCILPLKPSQPTTLRCGAPHSSTRNYSLSPLLS